MISTWKLIVCEMNPLSAPIFAPINRSARRLYSASLAELFMYTVVTQVNGGVLCWLDGKEETNFVKILQ